MGDTPFSFGFEVVRNSMFLLCIFDRFSSFVFGHVRLQRVFDALPALVSYSQSCL